MGEVRERPVEHAQVAQESHQCAEGDVIREHRLAAGIPDDQAPRAKGERDERVELAPGQVHLQPGVQDALIAVLIAALLLVFLGKGLDHAHPREKGVEHGIQPPARDPETLKVRPHVAVVKDRRDNHQGRGYQHIEAQRRRHAKEHRPDAQHEHDVQRKARHLRHQALKLCRILVDTGHQPPDLVLVKILDGQLAQMGEQLLAQAGREADAHVDGHPVRGDGDYHAHQLNGQQPTDQPSQELGPAPDLEDVIDEDAR